MLAGNIPPIWMPYWSAPEKRDQEWMKRGREGLTGRDLPYVEKMLGSSGGDYLCGPFTMADVPMMAVAMVLEVDAPDLSAFPAVERYLGRLRERKSYRAISPRTKVAEASSLAGA